MTSSQISGWYHVTSSFNPKSSSVFSYVCDDIKMSSIFILSWSSFVVFYQTILYSFTRYILEHHDGFSRHCVNANQLI